MGSTDQTQDLDMIRSHLNELIILNLSLYLNRVEGGNGDHFS